MARRLVGANFILEATDNGLVVYENRVAGEAESFGIDELGPIFIELNAKYAALESELQALKDAAKDVVRLAKYCVKNNHYIPVVVQGSIKRLDSLLPDTETQERY